MSATLPENSTMTDETGDRSDDTFEDITNKAQKVSKLYQMFLSQARWSYRITIFFFGLSVLFVIGLTIGSVIIMFQPTPTAFYNGFSISLFISAIVLMLVLIFRNPIKLSRRFMIENVKVDVIMTGYWRQIKQLDDEMKKISRLPRNASTVNDLRSLARQIQVTVDKTIEALSLALDETED